MAANQDAIEYEYVNVGLYGISSANAVAYSYVNIGLFGIASIIGKLYGIAGPTKEAKAYCYANVEP